MIKRDIPRILIAAPSSGSGKTTVVSGLLSAIRARGLSVQAFKVGPDYIDPSYHGAASGRPVYNLDTWLMDREAAIRLFADQTQDADVAVIEGVMGFYDGGRGGISSTAEIASLIGAPVLLVMDVRSVGESAAAGALGFRSYDPSADIRGVILNKLGSESHRKLITDAMNGIDMAVLGAIPRNRELTMPERHMGLVPAGETDVCKPLEKIRETIEKHVDIDAILQIAGSAQPLEIEEQGKECAGDSFTVAVAHDDAFCFYYPDSLSVLEELGARLTFFSPLRDKKLPNVSGIIFGGGFPEVFAEDLSKNLSMRESVQRAARKGVPIYAECGGFMYLTGSVETVDGKNYEMAGAVPLSCRMNEKLQRIGYVEAKALKDNLLCKAGTLIRGHEFHFSSISSENTNGDAAFLFTKHRNGESYRGGYASDNILASYMHIHFAGNRKLAASFAEKCRCVGSNR